MKRVIYINNKPAIIINVEALSNITIIDKNTNEDIPIIDYLEPMLLSNLDYDKVDYELREE